MLRPIYIIFFIICGHSAEPYSDRFNEWKPKEKCQMVSLPEEDLVKMRKATTQCTDFLKKNIRNSRKILNRLNGEQEANVQLLEAALREFGMENIYLDKNYPLQSFILQYQTFIHHDIRKLILEKRPKRKTFNQIDEEKTSGFKPFDCWDILQSGEKRNGVYAIYPRRGMSVQVYCDMITNDGGWTVLLSRKNQTRREDFYRPWIDYKNGFGNPATEYWLGNEALHIMTNSKTYTLRIEAEDYERKNVWGELKEFKVGSERNKYKLFSYSYNPSSTMRSDIFNYHFGMSFSTFDNDNDEWAEMNCAENKQGGWWYKDCAWFNPTGIAENSSFKTGIGIFKWSTTDSSSRILKNVQLKIRPTQQKY